MMHKQQYIEYLRRKFLQLKVQFLVELRNGKNLVLLKGLNEIIGTLDKEINHLQEHDIYNRHSLVFIEAMKSKFEAHNGCSLNEWKK